MSDTPKFEVIDRRRMKKQEEERDEAPQQSAPVQPSAETAAPSSGPQSSGPQLVVNEDAPEATQQNIVDAGQIPGMPPPPTAEESREQKSAYDASAERLEDILRSQNPGMGKLPQVTFGNLIQQFYVTAMIQMGAGSSEGQRPQIDILGARNTIDLLGVLAEKTRGNLTEGEEKTLQSVLFDARLAFLELTSMISVQSVPAPPPPGKR